MKKLLISFLFLVSITAPTFAVDSKSFMVGLAVGLGVYTYQGTRNHVITPAVNGVKKTLGIKSKQANLLQSKVANTVTGHIATISWVASLSTCTTGLGYNLYKGVTSGGEVYTTPINTSLITTLSYSDSSVVAGTTYYYTLESFCSSDNPSSSVPSSEVQAVIPGNQPLPPTGITVTAQ